MKVDFGALGIPSFHFQNSFFLFLIKATQTNLFVLILYSKEKLKTCKSF